MDLLDPGRSFDRTYRNDEKGRIWLTGKNRFRIYYEDTDFSGYVYHANYLKFFERSREELVGVDYVAELYKRGIHYIVAKMELSFMKPARHADLIEVRTDILIHRSPVSRVNQTAFLVEEGEGEPLELAKVEIKLAAVNSNGEPIRVPEDVLEHFMSLESTQNSV